MGASRHGVGPHGVIDGHGGAARGRVRGCRSRMAKPCPVLDFLSGFSRRFAHFQIRRGKLGLSIRGSRARREVCTRTAAPRVSQPAVVERPRGALGSAAVACMRSRSTASASSMARLSAWTSPAAAPRRTERASSPMGSSRWGVWGSWASPDRSEAPELPCDSSALHGAPRRIRTSDLRFRKPLLYPAELWERGRAYSTTFVSTAAATRRDSVRAWRLHRGRSGR